LSAAAAIDNIFATDISRTAGHPFNAQIEVFINIDFHDKRFNVNHGPGDIELFNNFFQYLVVILAGHDNQAVGGFVSCNLDTFRDYRCFFHAFLGRTALLGQNGLENFGQVFSRRVFQVVDPQFFFALGHFLVQQVYQRCNPDGIYFTGQHHDGIGAVIGHKTDSVGGGTLFGLGFFGRKHLHIAKAGR